MKERFIECLVIFSFTVVLVCALYPQPFVLAGILLALTFFMFKFLYEKEDFVYYILGMIIGPSVEIIDVYFGAWQYTYPNFLGIPVWLPIAWGLFSVQLKRTTMLVEKK